MANKFVSFWNNLWIKVIGSLANKIPKESDPTQAQAIDDMLRINLLDLVAKKITDLSMIEATFDVESESVLAEPLISLCKDIESDRHGLTYEMLTKGDGVVFPATNRRGEIVNSYVPKERFEITAMDGDDITEMYGVLDTATDDKGNKYNLIRKHSLDINGTLFVEVFVTNDRWEKAYYPEWESKVTSVAFANANHIGVGRYKCPVESRGSGGVYGVPMNYGCGELEERIFQDIENRDNEMNNGRSILFADQRILETNKGKKGFRISEFIFPKKVMAGAGGGNEIDVYNPSLRINEFNEKLEADLALYEAQIGLSKGILTNAEPTASATATEINTANADTVSFLNSVQTAVDKGNEETLKADAVFLNISPDLWAYKSDYYNPFENPEAQFNRLTTAIDKGAAEPSDMTKWLFPSMADEEIEEKLTRIRESAAADTNTAIERALSGV